MDDRLRPAGDRAVVEDVPTLLAQLDEAASQMAELSRLEQGQAKAWGKPHGESAGFRPLAAADLREIWPMNGASDGNRHS